MAPRLSLLLAAAAVGLVLAACGGGDDGGRTSPSPAATPTPDPGAQAAFQAWLLDYAGKYGLSSELQPLGVEEEGTCWSLRDSSDTEYLYLLAQCPFEMLTSVRVFREDGRWRAEQAHFQVSVGRYSLEEVAAGILQTLPPRTAENPLLERENEVVVALVPPTNIPELAFLNIYRFIRGRDELWRGYSAYDALHGGFATAEDAIIAFAAVNFPERRLSGDCAAARRDRDTGRTCWRLTDEKDDSRTYAVGPAFLEVRPVDVELVLRDRPSNPGAPAWFAQPEGAFP